MRVAGLAPVEGVPRIENIDLTDLVNGHMAYRTAMPRLLREVGWIVESDEFAEVEDPVRTEDYPIHIFILNYPCAGSR